jgi:hypothetical protein
MCEYKNSLLKILRALLITKWSMLTVVLFIKTAIKCTLTVLTDFIKLKYNVSKYLST